MGHKKGFIIDHIDRNGINCQISNLRFATHAQNAVNQLKRKNTSSKYIGVCINYVTKKDEKIWLASIKTKEKTISIGRFRVEEDAAMAYDRYAIKHRG